MNIVIDQEFKALIPPLAAEEFNQLEANILADGCRDPLVTWGGVLVDGHNRYEICTKHSLTFGSIEMQFSNRDEAMDWMDANQLGRRNLKPDQFTLLLGRRYNRAKKQGARTDLTSCQIVTKLPTAEKLAKEHGVSQRTVVRAGQFADAVDKVDRAVPGFSKMVSAGNAPAKSATVKAAAILETKPELAEAILTGVVTISEIEKSEKKEQRAALIQKQRDDIEHGTALLPAGVFEVVAIDPPWNYGREYDPDGSRVANPYPEMTQAQLLELNIPFADDSVLFLWTTHQFIWDAKALMDKWGFTYKATVVWDKERIGMGAWVRMQCEFCLVGIKGKPTWDNTTWRDIIREPRREHSRKPDAFYQMVEQVTVGRRLEYFSREVRKGWEVFGNDTGKF